MTICTKLSKEQVWHWSGKIDLITADCVSRWGWRLTSSTPAATTSSTTGSSARWSSTRRRTGGGSRHPRQTWVHLNFLSTFHIIFKADFSNDIKKKRHVYPSLLWINNAPCIPCYQETMEWSMMYMELILIITGLVNLMAYLSWSWPIHQRTDGLWMEANCIK